MSPRIWNLYRAELTKAVRRPFTYLGPVLIAIVILCAPAQFSLTRDNVTDFGFIAHTTAVMNLLGLVLLLSYCSGLISSELASGTIRHVLIRPVLRVEFLAGKLLLGVTYAVVLAGFMAAFSWATAWYLGELTPVSYGGEAVFTGGEMATSYVLGMGLGLFPQCAAVAYAVMISSFTRSTAGAIGSAVGIWLVVDLIKYPLHIAPLLFSSYLESPWQVFRDRCDGLDTAWFPSAYYTVGTSVGAFVLFSLLAGYFLQRRNLQG